MAAPEADLTFGSEDHPGSTAGSGMLPMLYTPTICNVAVTKTLIDGGAGLNLLSVEPSAFSMCHSSGSAPVSPSQEWVVELPIPWDKSASL